MTNQKNKSDSNIISVRKQINFILIIIGLLMLYLNHSWIITLIKQFINNI